MRRRSVLAAVGGGLAATAGCTSFSSAGDGNPADRSAYGVDEELDPDLPDVRDDPSEIEHGPTRIAAGTDPDRTIALPTVPFTTSSGPLSYEFGFQHPGSADVPPIFRVTATNTRSEPIDLEVGASPPLSAAVGRRRNEEGTMYALPFDGERQGRTDEGCWRLDEPALPDSDVAALELDAGEAVTELYALYSSTADPECLRPGTYRFPNPHSEWVFEVVVWDSDRIAPAPSRFADADVPSLPGADEVWWFHEADAETPIYAEPATESATLPADELEVALYNFSSGRVTVDAEDRGLFRLDDEWIPVSAPNETGVKRSVDPGDSDDVRMRVDPAETVKGEDLKPGLYAYSHGSVSLPDESSGRDDDRTIWPAALLELEE